ncbi:MAG: DUF4870 domain-containing protein [Haloarculaceae archaeon]
MTDENDDEPGVNDETVIRDPNEDDEAGGGPTVPTESEDGQGQPGGQSGSGGGGPSVPGGQGQSGGQDQPGGQSQSGGGGPSVPGQGQPTTGGGGQSSTGGQAQSTGGATQSGSAGTAAESGDSGLDSNVAGAIAYLLAPLGGIAMYVMSDEEFVQFHAKQGIAFGILLVVVWVGIAVVGFIGTFVAGFIGLGSIFGLLMGLVTLVAVLAGLGLWAFLTYKAYQGERYELPVIGGFVS